MTRPPVGRILPGPSTIAGASVITTAIQKLDIDPQLKLQILKQLGDVLPGRPVAAGSAATDRTLGVETLSAMIPSAAVIAAGLDPAKITRPAPDVQWHSGSQQLLVRVSEVRANLGNGLIEIVVPVTCDQTGDVDISVT